VDISLAWLIAGFILIVVELVTGTFYLLVLGLAALAAAGVAYAGGAFAWQALAATAAAVAGVIWIHLHRRTSVPRRMKGLDFGQPVAFESWVNKNVGHARVKYRDTFWDAQVADEAAGDPGEILYITSVDGNTLKVSKARPA
jgi:membrane protein implicated in regulation of membrane protease activity